MPPPPMSPSSTASASGWRPFRRRRARGESSSGSSVPEEMDMTAHRKMSVLLGDAMDGHIAGWLYVSRLMPRTVMASAIQMRRLAFDLRHCRLRGHALSLYADADADTAAHAILELVIVAVERIPERNKTFVLTDDHGQQLLAHTTLAADFEEWFRAFRLVVTDAHAMGSMHAAQAALAQRRGWNWTTLEDSTTAVDSVIEDYRPRAITEPIPQQHRRHARVPSPSSSSSASSVVIQHGEVDCPTHRTWLRVERRGWRNRLKLGRSSRRFHLVLTGSRLCGFDVNKEGHLAAFSGVVANARHDQRRGEVTLGSGRRLHLAVDEERDIPKLREFFEAIDTARQVRAPVTGGLV